MTRPLMACSVKKLINQRNCFDQNVGSCFVSLTAAIVSEVDDLPADVVLQDGFQKFLLINSQYLVKYFTQCRVQLLQ